MRVHLLFCFYHNKCYYYNKIKKSENLENMENLENIEESDMLHAMAHKGAFEAERGLFQEQDFIG